MRTGNNDGDFTEGGSGTAPCTSASRGPRPSPGTAPPCPVCVGISPRGEPRPATTRRQPWHNPISHPRGGTKRRSLGQAPSHAANREPRADSWRWPRLEAGAFELPAATRQDTGRPDGDGTAVIPCNWRSASDYVTQVRSQGKNPQLAT